MKTVGSNSKVGAFELLDREEVWEWGRTSLHSLEARIARYMEDITEMGRPWKRADYKGKWSASYSFRNTYLRTRKRRSVSITDRKRLEALPYFCSTRKYPTASMRDKIKALIDFMATNQRSPSSGIPEERYLCMYKRVLWNAAKYNQLTPEEADAVSSNGLLGISRETRRTDLLNTLRDFVQTNNRWPKRRNGVFENRLALRVADIIIRIRNNAPTYVTLQDLEVIPHFPGLGSPLVGQCPRGPK